MTSSPAPDLDELLKLAEAAGLALPLTTEEPRGCDDWPPNNRVVTERGPITLWLRPELSAYIVTLVNAAPALFQEVRAARAAVAESGRLREALPTRDDLADTLCYVRWHDGHPEERHCGPSMNEAERILTALTALNDTRRLLAATSPTEEDGL